MAQDAFTFTLDQEGEEAQALRAEVVVSVLLRLQMEGLCRWCCLLTGNQMFEAGEEVWPHLDLRRVREVVAEEQVVHNDRSRVQQWAEGEEH